MKKIVIDCRMIEMSGIGTYIQHIIPGLIQEEIFEIYCLGYEQFSRFEWAKFVVYIPMRSKILTIAEQIELFLKIPKCDIFWSPNWNIPLLPIKAKKKIATIHDVYHLANAAKFTNIKINVVRMFMRKLTGYSKIITVSKFSRSEIGKFTNIQADKIEVIPLAGKELKKKPADSTIREKYILYVGNVKPHKNLGAALEAFQKLDKNDVKFLIVGKREGFITNDNSMTDIIIKLGDRVNFTGYVSDDELVNYYQNASLFLFPSLYEGFGLPILEAMEAQTPILASNVASIPEVGGNSIHYFDPYDVNDLTLKLELFFEGKLPDLTITYESHLRKFNWQKAIDAHIKILV